MNKNNLIEKKNSTYSTLTKRILTAAVLFPLSILAIIFLPPLFFSILIAGVILLGAWEWSLLIGFPHIFYRVGYVICVGIGFFFAIFLSVLPLVTLAFVAWVWAFMGVACYQQNTIPAGFQWKFARALLGLIVLISAGISMITLKIHPNFGPYWLILILCIVWGADVGAFFAGRRFGKHALSSRVSPKKTWEGFFGGIIFSIPIAAIGLWFLHLSLEYYFIFLIISVIAILFSVVGDLSVSFLKRMASVKDSGNIFPGHGGLLDRLDSVAAATVIFVYGALLLGL